MPISFRLIVLCFCVLVTAASSPCAVNGQSLDRGNPPPDASADQLNWWDDRARETLLDQAPRWVTFDLDTVMLDTLRSSPRIQSVSRNASVALEQIIQQDAAFDPNVLFESRLGRTNDPVGNALITGGPPRLIEESLVTRGGIRRTTRRGTQVDFSQEVGLLDSNSNFFLPPNQGNARLSLSLTQPLMERGGQVYNERLLTQARIDSRVTWQEMRGQVEQRIADVINAYWRLYELRCHLLQQQALLQRGKRLESLLEGRQQLDASRIELAKARQRVARRTDRLLQVQADIQIQQARLVGLVGSDQLASDQGLLELIPLETPGFPNFDLDLRDALVRGLENRPEVRAAMAELESAGLAIHVTRTELRPQLTAVFEGYLAGLNGNRDILQSFGDQFSTGGPGLSGGLLYEMPYQRRAARSRHREAHHRYQQRSEELREAMQVTRAEIATAVVNAQTAMAQRDTKRRLLVTAWDEEVILTRRWEMMAGDGANVGTVLETLLDAQQRRTDAERELTSAATRYISSLVDLQRAMGTLLINLEITPLRESCGNQIHFSRNENAFVEPAMPLRDGPEAIQVDPALQSSPQELVPAKSSPEELVPPSPASEETDNAAVPRHEPMRRRAEPVARAEPGLVMIGPQAHEIARTDATQGEIAEADATNAPEMPRSSYPQPAYQQREYATPANSTPAYSAPIYSAPTNSAPAYQQREYGAGVSRRPANDVPVARISALRTSRSRPIVGPGTTGVGPQNSRPQYLGPQSTGSQNRELQNMRSQNLGTPYTSSVELSESGLRLPRTGQPDRRPSRLPTVHSKPATHMNSPSERIQP